MFDTPGVYLQELASGSAPIAGVATSNTAFVGVLARGPVKQAVRISSWSEFERVFGGLAADMETSHAIRSYFLNGGNIAFVVRADNGATAASFKLPPADGGITLAAASPGSWGNELRLGVAPNGAAAFDLLVRQYSGTDVVRAESFVALSADAADARYAAKVLARDSELLRVSAHESGKLPAASKAGSKTAASLADLGGWTRTELMVPTTNGGNGTLPTAADWKAKAVAAIGGGIPALDAIVPDVFNLMCLPDLGHIAHADRTIAAQVYNTANSYCERSRAFLIVDPPMDTSRTTIEEWKTALGGAIRRNAALYYPWLQAPDPLDPTQERRAPPSGAVAGTIARIDSTRGVWKAPAGTGAGIAGGRPVDLMTDAQQGPLNVSGINVVRTFPVYNTIIWGARTLDGADALASEWRYIPVRRLALHIENSLLRGLQWVVFEPNDEPLWASVRLNVTAFMSQLHRQGAFQGASARDAFLVKCDRETTTQADINLGILNLLVGFAPVRPAEFVLLRIQQLMQSSN